MKNLKSYTTLTPPLNAEKILAFTLAEVLITLAIIGVVAALTIPNVVQNYKKHVYSARLKKFVGVMQTVINKSKIDGFDWYKITPSHNSEIIKFTNQMKKYTKVRTKANDGLFVPNEGRYSDIITFPDGSSLVFDTIWGYILIVGYDVNGEQNGPNVMGKDRFFFCLCKDYGVSSGICQNAGTFQPFNFATTRQNAINSCSNSGWGCTSLLWFDGLEFKSDYPLKL